MRHISDELVASVVAIHFLRALLRIERKRAGLSAKAASKEAGWPAGQWEALERGEGPLEPEHWISAVNVLNLSVEDLVRRLNAYIEKHPAIWLEENSEAGIAVSERPITSDKALRSGNISNFELARLRPELYTEISSYSLDPEQVIYHAKALGFYDSRPFRMPPQTSNQGGEKARRERAMRIIEELSPEKFGLMERILDKFERFSAEDLAYAYQHFSLSVNKK